MAVALAKTRGGGGVGVRSADEEARLACRRISSAGQQGRL